MIDYITIKKGLCWIILHNLYKKKKKTINGNGPGNGDDKLMVQNCL